MSLNSIALTYVGFWVVAHIVTFIAYAWSQRTMNWNSLTNPTEDSPELPELNISVLFYYKEMNRYFLGKLVQVRDMKLWESDNKMHFPLPTGKITHWTPFTRVES